VELVGVPGAYRARNETATNCAEVIDIGWNGKSRVGLDVEDLTRRPSARLGRARRWHDAALGASTLAPDRALLQASV
jgi:hypothetical protein